jgi:DNA-binding CsgD family transcriptional regulator
VLVDLIGRAEETARLSVFLAACRAGPSALAIEGEPGIGKTVLFEQAVAAATDVRVLRTRCGQAEAGLAYAGLADLLGGWQPEYTVLAPPLRRALEVVLLRADPGDDVVKPHAVARATLEVLRSFASVTPVLVAIDDVQWLDTESARTLGFVLRRLDGDPVSVLMTRRGSHGTGDLDSVLSGTDRLRVGPLSDADMEALLDRRFPQPMPHAPKARVLAAAAGNPLYAIELVAAQHDEDSLVVPARLEELLTDRLARLPPHTLEPLAATASLAAPTVALVTAALGAEAKAGLECALDAGVVRVHEGRLWFSHPLLGMVAWNRVSPSLRRSLHTRLAGVVPDDEERARHLVLAADGPDPDTAAAAERAAQLARARGAPETAAQLAEASTRLTPPDLVADLRRRQISAGYHRATAGDVRRGREHMAAALPDTPHGPERADLLWRLGMLTFFDGNLRRAVELLEQAHSEANSDEAVAVQVLARLSGLYGWQGRLDESLRCWSTALDWAQANGDKRTELQLLATFGLTPLLAEAIALPDLIQLVTRLIGTTGPYSPHEDPEADLALFCFMAGDTTAATERLGRIHQRAVDHGEEIGQAGVASLLAQVELAAGNWQRARQLAEETTLIAHRAPVVRMIGMDLKPVALVEAHCGNVEAARLAATTLLEHAGRAGVFPVQLEAKAILGFVALSCGNARDAHSELGAVLDQLHHKGIREWGWLPLVFCELDALVELGEFDQATSLAQQIQAHGETTDRPLELATAARGRGLIHAAHGNWANAQAELTDSLAHLDRLGWPFDRARTLLALGIVQRRAKHKRAARETLQQALAIFDKLGAQLWSTKATAELARIGGRTAEPGGLTATERKVAELAADGYTNREIADRLFLSVKTVAGHLTSIYAKLGVRSRTELSRRLHNDRP